MRIWTLKQRLRQASIARRDHPWKNSTGPRTVAGKNRSKYNAFKHGRHIKLNRDLRRIMRSYKGFIRANLPYFSATQYKKHMNLQFELLCMIVKMTVPGAVKVRFCKNSLRQWLEKVANETINDYKALHE